MRSAARGVAQPVLRTGLMMLFALIHAPAQAAPPADVEPAAVPPLYLPAVMRQEPHVYWGALVNSSPPTPQALQAGGALAVFEARAQKKMAIIHWGQPWKMNGSFQAFQTSYFDNARNHGSIPMLSWGSWSLGGGASQPDFQLADITAGTYDAFVLQWAQAAKAWGHPFFLRFDWEMNGNWQFPWSEQINGNQSGDYVKAWRHVHDLFTQAGAANVTWVWCPNISGNTTRSMAGLYPGDTYVDWTCLDGYNKYPVWLPFHTVFSGSGITWLGNSYTEILSVAPAKPLMIGETASLEAGDGGGAKAQWIADTYGTQLPLNFPRIKAVVWFNWDMGDPAGASFPIETTGAATNAFAAAVASSYFTSNAYAAFNLSPIPPP